MGGGVRDVCLCEEMCESGGNSKWWCLISWQGCLVFALAGCMWLYLSAKAEEILELHCTEIKKMNFP